MQQNSELSLESAMPWDFKPLRGGIKVFAYVGATLLFFVMLEAVILVLIFPFMAFPDTQGPSASVLKIFAYIVLWLAIVAVAFLVIWAFLALNRRLDLTRYLKKCTDGSIYLLSGSVLRSFSGLGKFSFRENSLLVNGKLGPDLLWPLIIIIAIDILSGLVILSGGKSIVIGGLGVIILLAIYNAVLKSDTSLVIESPSVASVRCSGPIVKIRFKLKPVASLGRITLLLPPNLRAEFFIRFDSIFPEKLPMPYQEALKKIQH